MVNYVKNQEYLNGESVVLAWGCMPIECVTEYTDGIKRIYAGLGNYVTKDEVPQCHCNSTVGLIDGIYTAPVRVSHDGTVCKDIYLL